MTTTSVHEWPFWLDKPAARAAWLGISAEEWAAAGDLTRATELEGLARSARLQLEELVLEDLAFEGQPLQVAPRVIGRIMQAAYAAERGDRR